MADATAKAECSLPSVTILAVKISDSDAEISGAPQIQSLVDMYANAPAVEVWAWMDWGTSQDSSGAWAKGENP